MTFAENSAAIREREVATTRNKARIRNVLELLFITIAMLSAFLSGVQCFQLFVAPSSIRFPSLWMCSQAAFCPGPVIGAKPLQTQLLKPQAPLGAV
jgi:hypothetical protein